MAVLRIHKKQHNFIILDKTCLSEVSLTWAAKGLHTYLMGLPDDCRIAVAKLVKKSANGRDAVRRLLAELESAGYIQRTLCRDETTGRFGGIEYLVLEIPEPNYHEDPPAPEKPFSVDPAPKSPAPGNPTPEKASRYINNKYNNNLTNQGLITAANRSEEIKPVHLEKKAAAVFSSPQEQRTLSPLKQKPLATQKNHLLPIDSLIGKSLTPNQWAKVQDIAQRFDRAGERSLAYEIQYTLLNPKCFKACGNDFAKKLNAIRAVILRGDWQTPAQMVNENRLKPQLPIQALERDFRDAKAEALHFQRLLEHASHGARGGLEHLVSQARAKVHALKSAIAQDNAKAISGC